MNNLRLESALVGQTVVVVFAPNVAGRGWVKGFENGWVNVVFEDKDGTDPETGRDRIKHVESWVQLNRVQNINLVGEGGELVN